MDVCAMNDQSESSDVTVARISAVKSVQKEEDLLPVGGFVMCDEKYTEAKEAKQEQVSCVKMLKSALNVPVGSAVMDKVIIANFDQERTGMASLQTNAANLVSLYAREVQISNLLSVEVNKRVKADNGASSLCFLNTGVGRS
eukprot:757042-Hanusia_phi.AAC.3